MFKITVNGQARSVEDGTTVRILVEQFNKNPDKVAIELNRRLVRSSQYEQLLKPGDHIEIVTFVGGG